MKESEEAFKRERKKDWAIVLVAVIIGTIFCLVFFFTINPIFLIVGLGSIFLGFIHLAWASDSKKEA